MNSNHPLSSLTTTIRLFYFLKLSFLTHYVWNFFNYRILEEATWLWPVSWLGRLGYAQYAVMALAIVSLISGGWSIFKPYNRAIKIIEFVFSLMFMAAYFSYGKIDHGMHGMIYSSLFISLLKSQTVEKNDIDQKNHLLFKSAIAIFLFPYFLTGLWKARMAFESVLHFGLVKSLGGTLAYQLSLNMIASGAQSPVALWFIGLNESWQVILWLGIILFELSALVVIFKTHYLFFWGLLLITFHLMVFVAMDILFLESIMLALVFLVFGPYRKVT